MKWLFAILVALNIIVFGNVVASKLMRPPHATAQVGGMRAVQSTCRACSARRRAVADAGC